MSIISLKSIFFSPNSRNKKRFSEMSKVEKILIMGLVMPPIIYIYLSALQISLKSYPFGIAWLLDIMNHAEKLNSMPYMVYGFFLSLFILGYPIVFVVSMLACMICKWKDRNFGLAFLFPGMFIFLFIPLSVLGHIFVSNT